MKGKSFSIIIPAYNEEEAILEIVRRCLDAAGPICERTGLSSVEVVVVDDGSKDRTAELARGLPKARLVSHPVNRGYGRALMTGFSEAKGDYLGFLDADGTCDPLAFAPLLESLQDAGADLAVGNRLHPGSRMPRVREMGNRFYAALITRLSGVRVNDAASGMRVFKRDLLPRLAPMPSGLHFTPAMTARAACLGLVIVEADIPYAERQGDSKLSVIQDGFRFLSVILQTIFGYFPLRIFGPVGLFFGLVAFAYGLGPALYYLEWRMIREDMIYRLLTIMTFAVSGLVVLSFGLMAQKASDLAVGRPAGWLDSPGLRRGALALGLLLALGGVALNSKTILEYASSGRITLHWVYVLTGGLAVISGTVLSCFAVTLGLVAHLPARRS